MPTDSEIIAYHEAHPKLAPNHVARNLGCSITYVAKLIGRHMAKSRPNDYEPTPEEIAEFMRINREAADEEKAQAKGSGAGGAKEPAVRVYSTQFRSGTFRYEPE